MQITIFILSAILIILFTLAAYGWGRTACLIMYPDRTPGWPMIVALGLATWIFLGGVLNAATLAFPTALDVLLGLGASLSLLWFYFACLKRGCIKNLLAHLRQGGGLPTIDHTRLGYLIPPLVVIGVTMFLVHGLMPASAFNFDDDFYTYFTRPVRMLQTGTLSGNPFDLLGLDSLGAQAFMQAFIVGRYPIVFINGFDTIFCFALCGFLLIAIARQLQVHWGVTAASLAALILINPQYVNTSSLYSGSLMILALAAASAALAESAFLADTGKLVRRAIPVGLVLACLVSLKMTFAFFAASYFMLYFGVLIWSTRKTKRAALAAGLVMLFAAIFAAPWVTVSLPNYIAAAQAMAVTSGNDTAVVQPGLIFDDFSQLISGDKLPWGGSFLDYSMIVLLLLAGGVASLHLARQADGARTGYALTLTAACGASLVNFVADIYFFGPQTGLRYTCPVLIAVFPLTVIYLASQKAVGVSDTHAVRTRWPVTRLISYAAIVSALVVSALFANASMTRFMQVHKLRTMLSFPIQDIYLRYNKAVLEGLAAEWVHQMQETIPPHESVLAWVSVPFLLDYSRNRIISVTKPGVINPWLDVPFGGDEETLRQYLKKRGIRYVMLEHSGLGVIQESALRQYAESPNPGTRKLGRRNLYLRHALLALARHSRMLYQDSVAVVFDLNESGG